MLRDTSLTLSYSYGLEPVQFSQQAGALRRMKTINKLLRSPGRVERLHGLLQRVCAQVAPLHQRGQRGLGGEPCRGCHGGAMLVVESGSGQPSPGSQREGGPQRSPQAGQHLWDGMGWDGGVEKSWWRTEGGHPVINSMLQTHGIP